MNPSGQERISLYVGSMEGGKGREWRRDAVINGLREQVSICLSAQTEQMIERECVNYIHDCYFLPFALTLGTKIWIYFVESRNGKSMLREYLDSKKKKK